MSYLTVREFSKKYGVSSSSIYRKIRVGEIESTVKDGKKYVLDREESLEIEQKQGTEIQLLEESTPLEKIESSSPISQQSVEVIVKEKGVDEYTSILEKKLDILQRRVQKLEKSSVVVNSFLDNRFKLDLQSSIDLNSKDIPLKEYLKGLGYAKKYRKVVYNRFDNLLGRDQRVVETDDGNYLLLFSKYSYEDLLKT